LLFRLKAAHPGSRRILCFGAVARVARPHPTEHWRVDRFASDDNLAFGQSWQLSQ